MAESLHPGRRAVAELRSAAPATVVFWAIGTVLLLAAAGLAEARSPVAGSALTGSGGGLTIPALQTNTSALDLGMTLNVSVNVSGIVGGTNNSSNWHYAWSGLPANCTSADVANYSCVPTATGSFPISVAVSDRNDSATGSSTALTITVNSDPEISAFTVSNAEVSVGGSITFTVTAGGGTGPLTYNYQGLPAGCDGTGATVTCTPTTAQTYNASVYVNDSVNGTSAIWSLTVKVTGTGASGGGPHPTTTEWAIVGAILGLGFLVVILLLIAARRVERRAFGGRAGSAPAPGGPGSPPTSGSGPEAAAPPTQPPGGT